MNYDEMLATLRYAGDHSLTVRVALDGPLADVVGVPTSLDEHVTAHEVYLRVPGAEETEIAVSLGSIVAVELAGA